jgi:hypothetical protein
MNVLGEPPEGLLPDPRLVGLPRHAAHRRHLSGPILTGTPGSPPAPRGDAFCLAAPARRANINGELWRGLCTKFEAGSGAFIMEPVRSVATIRRMSSA